MITFILDADAGFAVQTNQWCDNIDDYITILDIIESYYDLKFVEVELKTKGLK